MRWAILVGVFVWLIAGANAARAQFGLTLPFGDSGGGLSIGVGGGPSKGAPSGQLGTPGAKLVPLKASPPLKTPQFKADAPKAPTGDLAKTPHKPDLDLGKTPPRLDLAKTPPKLDLGKTPPSPGLAKTPPTTDLAKTPSPAGLGKDAVGDKPPRANGPADAPKPDSGGDGKTPDQTAGGPPRAPDDRLKDGPPKRDDKYETGVTLDGGSVDPRTKVEDSGGAIVIYEDHSLTPSSRPVVYVPLLSGAKCGPDITEEVLATLRSMAQAFDAHPDRQEEACSRLISPSTGNQAWDINGLDPTTGGTPGHYQGLEDSWSDNFSGWLGGKLAGTPLAPYGPTRRKWVAPQPGTWLTGISAACAIPRPYPICAATVEFMGTCQHAQVVNYAMWGMIMGLCNEKGTGVGRAIGEGWRSLRNFGKHLATPPDQELMVKVGARYHDFVRGAGDGPPPDTEELANWLKYEDDRADHPERACPLHCDLSDLEKRKIKIQINGFDWDGLTR